MTRPELENAQSTYHLLFSTLDPQLGSLGHCVPTPELHLWEDEVSHFYFSYSTAKDLFHRGAHVKWPQRTTDNYPQQEGSPFTLCSSNFLFLNILAKNPNSKDSVLLIFPSVLLFFSNCHVKLPPGGILSPCSKAAWHPSRSGACWE